ncbi:hypothetical protein WJX74_001210 [Apatococcus lobatus]|uniref:rRNA methylase n=2 Tax=Apatococcus TaxID=904362 RepID=A0AAW1SZM1_9CHLO
MPPRREWHAARAARDPLSPVASLLRTAQRALAPCRKRTACAALPTDTAFLAGSRAPAKTAHTLFRRLADPCNKFSPGSVQALASQAPIALRKPVNVRVTSLAHQIWSQVVDQGDMVVDATCGRGADTLWLANAVGPTGTVHAFDIQDEAIRSSRVMIEEAALPGGTGHVSFVHDSHANMQAHLPKDAAIMLTCFNLGYLPSGDKSLTTQAESTLAGLKAASETTAPGGLISIISYTHHPGGRREFEAVQDFASKLPPEMWLSSETHFRNRQVAPALFNIYRLPSR